MDFNLNLSLYRDEETIRKYVIRYMTAVRQNMGLSFFAIQIICEKNYIPNCAPIVWHMETGKQNPTIETFWTACAIYRIHMTIIESSADGSKELISVPPNFEINYPMIRKKIGVMLQERRMARGESLSSVAKKIGVSKVTIMNIESGAVNMTLKKFLALMAYYGFIIDFKQTTNL